MIRYYCNACRKQKPPEELRRVVLSISSTPVSRPDVRGVGTDNPYLANLAGEICVPCADLLISTVGGKDTRNEALASRRAIEDAAA